MLASKRSYRVSKYKSTGYSPYFMMYHRQPRLPIDVEFFSNHSLEDENAANDSALIVTQYPVQQQSGSTDCGLFSIAFAYHAAIGDNLRTL